MEGEAQRLRSEVWPERRRKGRMVSRGTWSCGQAEQAGGHLSGLLAVLLTLAPVRTS